MNKYVAAIFSYLFHPLMIPTYFFILVLYLPVLPIALPSEKYRLVVAIFVMTFLLPVISTFTLRISGSVSSMMLERRRERMLPLAFAVVTYAISTFFCYKYIVFEAFFYKAMGFITLVLLFLLIVNFFEKISAHASGNGGFLAILLALPFDRSSDYFLWIICTYLVVVGFVLSSRMALGSHTPRQVLLGFLLGFLTCLPLRLVI